MKTLLGIWWRFRRPHAGLLAPLRCLLLLSLPVFFFLCITEAAALSDGPVQPAFRIIDVHEHLLSSSEAFKIETAMERHGVSATVLVASPLEVLGLGDSHQAGFTDPERNNKELLQISKKAPEKFYAFATYSPADRGMLEKLKLFIRSGGKGLKLYNGHYMFYDMFCIPLDAPHMMAVYAWCEENRIPIIFHANARYYWFELKHILDTYPKLFVDFPHFCMSIVDLDRICEIFDSYENVYSDISLGEGELGYTSLEYVSRYRDLFRILVLKYKTRFLFGADMVVTDDPEKDEAYAAGVIDGYRRFLEQERYASVLFEKYLEEMDIDKTGENLFLNGLHLDEDTLKHIYEINPKKFLGQDP